MKKAAILFALFMLVAVLQIPEAHAVSTGYERYVDDECEVQVEYFPIVPFDPAYPTASEEFAIKFFVTQNHWWEPILVHVWPHAFSVWVYFRDDTCGDINYVTWKRWYPTSVSQHGWNVGWELSGGYGPLSIGATISTPDSWFTTDYNKYPVDDGNFMHLSHLVVDYNDNWFWGETFAQGVGSLGVPNDAAQPHEGHHVLIWVIFELEWHVPSDPPIRRKTIGFCVGDDVPADTDCWLTVEQGNTGFNVYDGSGGSGCPILSVFDGSDYVTEGLLDIHNPDGVDLVYNHTLITEPAWTTGTCRLRLTEHPQTHSYIDQVRLYAALEDGTEVKLPLIYAWHSEHGNVLPQLLFSDEWKTDTLGADFNNGTSQSIDLRFAAPLNLNIVSFVFQIEGNNVCYKR